MTDANGNSKLDSKACEVLAQECIRTPVSAIVLEGGGQRSLYLAAGYQRGMDLLKKGESVGENAKSTRFDVDLGVGVSGGAWGVAALAYSRTLATRTGVYTPPEKLTAGLLSAQDKSETVSRLADPSLGDRDVPGTPGVFGNIPFIGQDQNENVLKSGIIENAFRLKGWWHWFAGYFLNSLDIDPLTPFVWCSEKEAEKAFNPLQVAEEAKRDVRDALFPAAPKCQRPNAPYPVVVTSDLSWFKTHDGPAPNGETQPNAPAVEFTPNNIHIEDALQTRSGEDWVDVSSEKYTFECPEDVTPSMPKLTRIVTEDPRCSNPVTRWFCQTFGLSETFNRKYQKKCQQPIPPLVSPLARSSFMPGILGRGLHGFANGNAWYAGFANVAQWFLNNGFVGVLNQYEDSVGNVQSLPASQRGPELRAKKDFMIKMNVADGGATEQSGLQGALRNGATRVVVLNAEYQDRKGVEKIAALSDADFGAKSSAELYTLFGCEVGGCDLPTWFGLQGPGYGTAPDAPTQGLEEHYFDRSGFHALCKNLADKNWDNTGMVASASVRTVENKFHGIPADLKVLLTTANVWDHPGWTDVVEKSLGADFNARKECVDDAGPFSRGVWNKTTVECARLMTNLITWHVLQNPRDFDYSLGWEEVAHA